MSNTMTIKGLAGGDAELRFTPSGQAVASFSVADTPRRKGQDGRWEDAGPTLWQRVQVWNGEAEKAAEEVRKGALVTVQGRVKADEWTDKQTGEQRRSTTLVADTVYVHPPRNRDSGGPTSTHSAPQGGGGYSADPWGSNPQNAAQGFGGDSEPPF